MSSPKVDHAIVLVKELIQSGEIRPGERLPNEADLAARLGVSRNSLREAVRALQTLGVLEARQGDGTYVSNLDPAVMIDVLQFAVDVSDARSIVWFLELRRTLEVAAVQSVAARRTPEQLRALHDLHGRLLKETDAERCMSLDADFHNLIAEIGSNPVHAALLRVVSAPTMRARISRQRTDDSDFQRVRSEHSLILAAIEEQSAEDARHAMWLHMGQVINWVKTHPETINHPEVVK